MDVLSAAAAIAAVAAWLAPLPQQPTDGSRVSRHLVRARALDPVRDADRGEHAALLRAARALAVEADVDAGELLALLQELTWFSVMRSTLGDDVRKSAVSLVTCYREVLRCHPEAHWLQVDHRHWGEACLLAHDHETLAEAVRRGLSAPLQTNRFERAAMQIIASKLHCLLGRVEDAASAVADAQAAAEELSASRAVADRQDVDQLQLAVSLATFDVCLLGDDVVGASAALDRVPKAKEADFHRLLLAVLRGDSSQEVELESHLARRPVSREMRRLALAKLTQMALMRGDLEAAAKQLDALRIEQPIAGAEPDGRTAVLAFDLFLQQHDTVTAPLLADIRGAFDAALGEWRRAPQLPGGTGPLSIGDRSTLVATALRAEAVAGSQSGDARQALRQLLRAQQSCRPELLVPDVDEALRELLGPDRGLLAYTPGRFGTALLCCDANGVRLEWLPPARQLRDLVDRLRDAAATALQEPGEQQLQALQGAAETASRALLPPSVRERLRGWRGVTITGASMLQNAPFGLLSVAGDSGPRWLGHLLPIDYVANLVAGAGAAPRRELRHGVVFAASVLAARVDQPLRMPAATGDLDDLYVADGLATTMWLDGDVRVETLRRQMPAAAIVHCIGHGEIAWGTSYEHGIRFDSSADGLLSGDRVVGLDLRGLVVILGSCRAGQAPLRRGGEPMAASLAGALLDAGVRCVIVPTTDVQLGRHLQAARHMHAAFAAHASPAMALFAARTAPEVVADPAASIELLQLQVQGRGF